MGEEGRWGEGLKGEWGKGRNGLGRRVKNEKDGGGGQKGREGVGRGQDYFTQKGLLYKVLLSLPRAGWENDTGLCSILTGEEVTLPSWAYFCFFL